VPVGDVRKSGPVTSTSASSPGSQTGVPLPIMLTTTEPSQTGASRSAAGKSNAGLVFLFMSELVALYSLF
jgi:hypothetical protein